LINRLLVVGGGGPVLSPVVLYPGCATCTIHPAINQPLHFDV